MAIHARLASGAPRRDAARRRIPRGAQPTGEGAKFYAEYRAAFAKAKAVEDLVPYLSKGRAEMVGEDAEGGPRQDVRHHEGDGRQGRQGR